LGAGAKPLAEPLARGTRRSQWFAAFACTWILGHAPLAAQAERRAAFDAGFAADATAPRSARVLALDEPIHFEPRSGAARRGAAMQGASLPVFAKAAGPGCVRGWVLVGPEAWVCSDRVELGAQLPAPVRARSGPPDGALPFAYHFVGPEGSFGYDHLAAADIAAPIAELQPGFAVALTEIARSGGEPYGRTTKGLWLPMRDLAAVRPSPFSGGTIDPGSPDMGWTLSDETPVYDAPGGARRPGERVGKRQRLELLEHARRHGQTWLRFGPDRWLRRQDIRRFAPATPPQGIGPTERWIHIDLANQTVAAYIGPQPVYATLASTGKGRGREDPRSTPVGEHRIWVKLRTSDMTNLENADASRYYAMEEVPWVMFFSKGYGLHGAYWHDAFGHVRSHGCVNLAPRDAEWFFDWAGPHLPEGWRAVFPTDYDPGTLVRIETGQG
jgi:hypothetical protein